MKQTVFVLTLALCLASASALWAAEPQPDPNFEMRVMPPTSTVAEAGGVVDLSIQLTTKNVDTQGWSFGVRLTNDAGVTSKIKHITFGPGLLTTNDGGQVGFSSTSFFILPDQANKVNDCGKPRDASGAKWDGINCNDPANPINADALTNGGVVDMGAIVLLPPTANLEILGMKVEAAGPAGSFATAEFTNDFGDPKTPTVVVYNGASLPPAVKDPAKIGFRGCVPANPFTIDIQGGKGGTNASVNSVVTLNFNKDGTNPTAGIQGWSYGICDLDPTKLELVSATVDGTDTGALGLTAQQIYINIYKDPAGLVGVTQGIVIDFGSVVTIPSQNDWTDLVVTYKVLMTADGQSCYVVPCHKKLGPAGREVANVMVIGGESFRGSQFEGTDPAAECCNPAACNTPGKFEFLSSFPIRRGNANGDGRLDIADGIYLLNYLFRAGPPLACQCAGDADGNKALEATDAIRIIYYVLDVRIGGVPPLPPEGGVGCQLILPADCGTLTCETPAPGC